MTTAIASSSMPKKIGIPAFRSHIASERRIFDRWDNERQAARLYDGRVVIAPRIGAFMDIGEGVIKGTWAIVASTVTSVVFRKFRHAYYQAVLDQFSSALWSLKVLIKPNWALNTLFYTHKFQEKGWTGPYEGKERRFVQGSYHKDSYGTKYDSAKRTWRSKIGVIGNVPFTSERV